ncbi:MAG TPA: hypothetical protein VMV49_11600 [Candidatus Deferrimicrobium sp.]|nr:hypothetical protein [Candidatus Deferrimicrobium sp.]
MGFIDSIILLILFGWLSSLLYRKYLRKRNKDWLVFLGILILLGFWIVEILLYVGIIDMYWLNSIPWINIPMGIPSGQYYLWNSFLIFGINFGIMPTPELASIAIVLFLSYPLWYRIGIKIGRILHGYYTHEEGILWLLRSPEKKNER